MRNRVLTFFIALSMILSMFTFSASAEKNTDFSQAEQICLGLGCISEEEYNREKKVTRAEFAKIISNLCGWKHDTSAEEWNDSAYGEVNDGETVIINPKSGYFDDVDKSHPCYNEIIAVYTVGYMKGISERRFAPEYDISVLEVSKVITDMLGYAKMAEMEGGYPTGYEKVITRIGLTNGVTVGLRDIVTEGDIIKIIYNALNIHIIEFKISGDMKFEESDKSFMEGVLKTYRARGTVTDNGITAIDGKSYIENDEIKVAEVVAFLPESMSDYRKYIGRVVDMYYTYDEDADKYVVRYIIPLSNDETVTFNIDDFVEFSDGTIKYILGRKAISEKIDVNANLIYNNKYKGVYDESVFDFEAGDVTLCSTAGDGEYDLIIINDYDFLYVTGKNDAQSLIYNGIKSGDSELNALELTEENYEEFLVIKNEAGKTLSFEEIETGDVLNILNCDGGIEITVSKSKVSDFKIISLNKSDLDRTVISDGNESYEILDVYSKSNDAKNIRLNDVYTVHLNMFGKVVWLSGGDKEDYQVGIITKVIYDEDESLRLIKIYTEGGVMTKLNSAEKISVNGQKYKFEKVTNILEGFAGEAVLYKVSEDGEVTHVISAAEFMNPDEVDRGWHRINPDGSYNYGQNGHDLGGFFYYVKGKTVIFTVPADASDYQDEDNFSVGVTTLKDNDKYEAEGFSTSPDAIEADVIVLRQEASSGGSVDAGRVFLIETIEEGLNADDELVTKFKGYEMTMGSNVAESKVLELDPNAIMVGMGETADQINPDGDIAVVGPRTPDELEEGDVIRYNINAKGNVDCIRIAYDYDLGKPYHGSQGTENSAFAQGSSFAGWVLSKVGNGVRFTNGIKPENIDYKKTSELLANVKAMRLNNAPILVVEKNGKNIRIRVGSMNDIVAYSDSLMVGGYDRMAIFTYYSGNTYGAVIYK